VRKTHLKCIKFELMNWSRRVELQRRSCGGDGAINGRLLPTERRRQLPMTYGQDMPGCAGCGAKVIG